MTLYFITGSEGKLAEAKQILRDDVQAIDIDLPELQELDVQKVIEAKLKEAMKATGKQHIFCEDTSAHLDALYGFPGPLIKWMAKAVPLEKFVDICKGNNSTKVTMTSTIGYYDGKQTHYFSGSLRGDVVAPRGDKDFGWGPIFQPEGYDQTFGEMNRALKNSLSMRSKAFEKFKAYLEEKNSPLKRGS